MINNGITIVWGAVIVAEGAEGGEAITDGVGGVTCEGDKVFVVDVTFEVVDGEGGMREEGGTTREGVYYKVSK